jgi:hypothetical protein
MMLQILLYHFVGHFTYRCTKIPAHPKMLPSVTLFQQRILLEQLACRPAFNPPHDFTGTIVGGAETKMWTWPLLTTPFKILISKLSHVCFTNSLTRKAMSPFNR